MKSQSKQKLNNSQTNILQKLINEQWKGEQDYKKSIISLETQNEKYRNQLYELGETVSKILDKTKIKKNNTPTLENQLQVIKKQLENANKFIEIYKKQLKNIHKGESVQNQLQIITKGDQILKIKQKQLNDLKKQVKQLTTKNRGLQYKLNQYTKRGKVKNIDTSANMLKQAIQENINLRRKIEQIQQVQKKKQTWLKNNVQSSQNLQKQILTLPSIQRKSADKYSLSLPKLENEKKIYTKWLQTNKNKGFEKLQKEIQEMQKINKMVTDKINTTSFEINEIKQQIKKIKDKISPNEIKQLSKKQQQIKKKTKDYATNFVIKSRKSRRDWTGKFDGLRFSDSRYIRQQTRLYKIVFNSVGYYQFHYYSIQDKNKLFVPQLPFDINQLNKGKDSTFTVQYPDYIKYFKIKINIKTHKIFYIQVISNLGITAEFIDHQKQNKKVTKGTDKQKIVTQIQEPQILQTLYNFDIKSNEAPICIFGSYNLIKAQDKKTTIHLQGLGIQLIQDIVQEKL